MAENKPRLLITGGSGFLGTHLIPIATRQWEVHNVVHQNDAAYEAAVAHKVNLNDFYNTLQTIRLLKPDFVLHMAANANANHCQTFPWSGWKINVEASAILAKVCAQEKIGFAFASTDLVFDGEQGNYKEEDTTNPISKYGMQKEEAEKLILQHHPSAAIIRLPLMFGSPAIAKQNFLAEMISKLTRREKVNLFTDEYRSVCGANSVAKGIVKLMSEVQGIIHLGGSQRLSRYEFGMMAAKIFGLDTSLIVGCKQSEVRMAAPRPKDVSLNSDKAIYLGFRPLSSEEELMLIANAGTLN